MKKLILSILAGLILCGPAFGWGREAHEIIAKIADNNLKPSARKTIEKYLDNHSVVYWAKWMDDYRRTPEYAFTSNWHVSNVDKDLKYYPNTKNGDAVSGMKQAIEALKNGENDIKMMVDEYNRRRRYIYNGLRSIGIESFEPEGAFYIFPRIGDFGLTGEEFCNKLLYEYKCAIVPGNAFGASGEGFARISYAYSIKHITQALERIEAFVKTL